MSARPVCQRCWRPSVACYCAHLVPIESRTRACFLQHPRETKMAVGTAWMAHLSLPNSELHRGVEFAEHPRVRELLESPGTALLFPGNGSLPPEQFQDDPPRTIVIVDGTWSQARKLIRKNPSLAKLPRIGFVPARPSNYRIRRQPREGFVSTIEAVVHVLGALEGAPERFAPLLRAFERMVDVQLEHKARRTTPPRVRKKHPRRSHRVHPEADVAVYAESNGSIEAPELLRLTAARFAAADVFDAWVALPVPEDLPAHLETRPPSGLPVAEVLGAFAAFLRPTDVLCGWGGYAPRLLPNDGGGQREFIDVRLAAMRRLRRRPGGVEQALRMLGRADLPAPLVNGRAGRRLAALMAVQNALVTGAGA